jgi:hypothetical protein
VREDELAPVRYAHAEGLLRRPARSLYHLDHVQPLAR